MDHICVVFPILPGKTEDARAFERELDTERKADAAGVAWVTSPGPGPAPPAAVEQVLESPSHRPR